MKDKIFGYKQAKALLINGKRVLRSYETLVASIDDKGTLHRHWDGYSPTTARHISIFMRHFDAELPPTDKRYKSFKSQWLDMPVEAI